MLNVCQFIGNLGADPEVRHLQSGDKVVNLRLAVTEKWTGKDGKPGEKTEWIPIAIFNQQAAKYAENFLRKGSKCFVSGKWTTRSWEKDGEKHYTTELVLQNFSGQLIGLDGKSQDGEGRSHQDGGRGSSQKASAKADEEWWA